MIVSSFTDTRGDNTVSMDVALEGHGKAALYIKAAIHIRCEEHHRSYLHEIEGEVACNTKLDKEDMDDLEMAIRGWPEHGNRLAWRTVRQILKLQGDQCHQV